jgi:hypothetical protein
LLGRPPAVPADTSLVSDRRQAGASVGAQQSTPVDGDAHPRILAEAVLSRLERQRADDCPGTLIPARSRIPASTAPPSSGWRSRLRSVLSRDELAS